MIKYFKYLIIALILGFSFGSCTDLTEDLKGEITEDISIKSINKPTVPQVDPGFGALDAAYKGLRDAGSANHGSYYSLQEITSDEMCIGAKGGDWFDGGILIDLHRHTYKPNHDFVRNAWNGSYGAINTCNELLAKNLSPSEAAQVKALRAYFYMRLCDLFGRVKIITKSGVDAPQASRVDVYNFVEKELLEVLGITEVSQNMNLSNSALGTDRNPYKINVFGALGILAKLYLNAEVYAGKNEYAKAGFCANYIIEKGPYTLCGTGCKVPNLGKRPSVASDPDELEGYPAVFAPNNQNNPEHIFSIFYDEVRAGGMNFSQMNLHYSSQFTWNLNSQPWNGYATLEEFYNSYEAGDVRKAANFIVGPQTDFTGSAILDYAADDKDPQLNYTPKINELAPNSSREGGARPAKFSFKQFGRPNMDNDYTIIRLGEMYLIRAEALARATGNWANALSDVNVIRARAKVSPLNSLTAESFLAERGREMFQESARRTDLIRFGKYNGTWWEKPASQPFVNIFPIPQEQINASNGTLTQNPGY